MCIKKQWRTQDFFKGGGGGLTFLNRAEIFATTQPAVDGNDSLKYYVHCVPCPM